jgi:hypothetical protein
MRCTVGDDELGGVHPVWVWPVRARGEDWTAAPADTSTSRAGRRRLGIAPPHAQVTHGAALVFRPARPRRRRRLQPAIAHSAQRTYGKMKTKPCSLLIKTSCPS